MPTILVVDDDADTCRNMADLFGDLGYAVETAEGATRPWIRRDSNRTTWACWICGCRAWMA